ncbi:MAG: [FeFe] hydrogenase H-cluster radical SAM maturase HydE [Coriobacteriia bacterium]|nr:[FeFe] hydrogenase H-cluster radical SAM maturase HydE [Coriobacteriia bacterium]
MQHLLDKLARTHSLEQGEYDALLRGRTPDLQQQAAELAAAQRQRVFGSKVYTRGLIEISNYCKNNCRYCGIRAENNTCERYRLDEDTILACAAEGYRLGFRTFVLQGGEDPWFTDQRLCRIVSALRAAYPDCAITLSVGERSRMSYAALREAGADRYLLRHETADPAHYAALHPASMRFNNRMQCLRDLRAVGFVVGAGFMVGTPGQTPAQLAADLRFVQEFHPEMCGIGPFIPHHATPFAHEAAGSVDLTLFCLSLLRLALPNVLLPATTALGTAAGDGRERGILAGANVVMPNLSPPAVRSKYDLYDGKASTGAEAAEGMGELATRMQSIGATLVVDRGDPPGWTFGSSTCAVRIT